MAIWFSDETKAAVRTAVREVESETNAEVVVVVRRTSGHYLHADMMGGLALAMAALGVFLYYPEPFEYTYFPLEQLGAFALGALATRAWGPLRRALVSDKLRRESVASRARSLFMEKRLGRTRARNAVLVYVSAFEREAAVVTDVGLDTAALGDPWADAVKIIERAVREEDTASFSLAVRALGPILADVSPKTADDTNELTDEVSTDDEDSDDEDSDDEGSDDEGSDDEGSDDEDSEDEDSEDPNGSPRGEGSDDSSATEVTAGGPAKGKATP
jgi:putative membrane protein